MEKRIKLVWILTLLTCTLMIGGQGYWLYNQYCYSVDEHMRTLHEQLLTLEKDEFTGRNKGYPMERNFKLSCQMQLADTQNIKGKTSWIISFEGAESKPVSRDSAVAVTTDSFHVESIPADMIFEAASRYATELAAPFTVLYFDSLLRAHDMVPEKVDTATVDSCGWAGSYVKGQQLFPPTMEIVYPYNPLKKKVATATLRVPLHPLISQMGWQLLGSVCLAILLLFCMVYQIKTILKQQRIDEMRKNFVNTMIHELKRPVQTLKMCVAVLSDKTLRCDEQAMDDVVRDAMFELDNLTAYLTKVRDMTRADYENTPLSIRTFDMQETVERLVRLCNRPADKTVNITTRFDMDTPLVTADPVHLANIISNLVENAVKYSHPQVNIHIDCQLHNSRLTLAITDNGIGIPASAQARVFDKFYRADNLPDRNIPGIGLGLSYVKLLTEAHHGTVSLQSRPGEGTTIHIIIPQ